MNRIWLAMQAFWFSLVDPDFAAEAERLVLREPSGADLRVLAILQRDGRLVDFLQEDIDTYTDSQVGAAVRDIHRGCRKALREYLSIEPVLPGEEGHPTTVGIDFDPATVQLTGHVVGGPPFRGVLKHHGWRVKTVQLPALPGTRDRSTILAPAEVEIS